MIRIRRYNCLDRELWDNFCKKSKLPLFIFERGFMEYHKERFTDHSLLFFNEQDKLIALLPINEKDDKLFSHAGLTYGGFIYDTNMKQHTMNECFQALVEYARENGFKSILYKAVPHIFHEVPAEEDRYSLFLQDASIIKIEPATVVDLEHQLKMPKGRKAQISRSRREGVIVKELFDEQSFYEFINLENEVLGKYHNAKAVHSGKEMYLLHSRFPEKVHLFGAFYEERLIAGSVLYEYGQLVHTTYLAANDLAREIGGLDLTIYTMIEHFKGKKKWFDFGISSENGGREMMNGLIAQKEGFGGRTNIYDTWIITI